MTRLISADLLKAHLKQSRDRVCNKDDDNWFVDLVVDGMIEQIDSEPTFDAIPVAWIEQYGKANWYDFGTQYNAITEMLEEWERKEE